MATVNIPAYGYGIRYVHGLFRQQMADGWQVELPESWLAHGNPWEFERRESSYEVGFGGTVETVEGPDGEPRYVWKQGERVIATAYDTRPSAGVGERVNTLRLWSAQPIDPILLDAFNAGDHIGALRESNKAESLTRVLYPADATPAARNCACARNSSSVQPRYRTSSADTFNRATRWPSFRKKWPSS